MSWREAKNVYLCAAFREKANVSFILNFLFMATKIRLQRHGHKAYPYYHIVIADARAPRDGRCIERIGTYNPNTDPVSVTLKFDRALYWVNVGAQPTDTARNILSSEGVYLMKHLQGGVKKGAFDEAEMQKRFDAWKQAKEDALNKQKSEKQSKAAAAYKQRQEDEKAKNKAKAEALAQKLKEAAAAEAEAAKAAAEEAAAAEAPAEASAEVTAATEETAAPAAE